VIFFMYNNLEELLHPTMSELNSDKAETANHGGTNWRAKRGISVMERKNFGSTDEVFAMATTTTMTSVQELTTVSASRQEGLRTIINSKIVSASVGDANTTHLSEPVIFALEHKTVLSSYLF
jgi:hypothetical protein